VQPVRKEHKVFKVLPDQLAPPVQQVQLERKEFKVFKVLPDLLVLKVFKAYKVFRVQLVQPDHRVYLHMKLREQMDLVAHKPLG
jgi:hypothetical protein